MLPSDKRRGQYLTSEPNTFNSMEQLDRIRIYLNNVVFRQDILHRSIAAICYIYHCLYGIRDAHRSTSSASNFIFTVALKVLVKPLVFASKLQLCDVGRLLHLKHRYRIDAAARYSTKVQWPPSYSSHPRLVATPFSLLKVIVATAINW